MAALMSLCLSVCQSNTECSYTIQTAWMDFSKIWTRHSSLYQAEDWNTNRAMLLAPARLYNIIQTSFWVCAHRSTKNRGQREDKLVEEALLGGILAFLPVWIQTFFVSIKWCKWYPSAGSFATTFDPLRKIKLKTYFGRESYTGRKKKS